MNAENLWVYIMKAIIRKTDNVNYSLILSGAFKNTGIETRY